MAFFLETERKEWQMGKNNKNARVEFRLSYDEKILLKHQARSKNMSVGEYLRMLIIKPPEVTSYDFQKFQADYIYHIRKIGVNLNQIAKKYNEGNFKKPRQEVLDGIKELTYLTMQVNAIAGKWYGV